MSTKVYRAKKRSPEQEERFQRVITEMRANFDKSVEERKGKGIPQSARTFAIKSYAYRG